MALEVIGAGLGRTGTSSIRQALVELGYPCSHMFDLLFDPRRRRDVDAWVEAAADPEGFSDWGRLFHDDRASIDFPAAALWRQQVAAFPQAKVLLTLHPGGARAWVESARATIYHPAEEAGSPFARKVNGVLDRLVWEGVMQGTMADPEAAARRYEAHAEEVRAAVPPDRLLAFTATEGWGPLCAFLGVPVPDRPFPNINGREEMRRLVARLDRLRGFNLGGPASET